MCGYWIISCAFDCGRSNSHPYLQVLHIFESVPSFIIHFKLWIHFSIYLFISGSCEEEFVFLYLQYVFGFPFSLKIVRHRRRRRRRQTLEGSFSAVWTATIARKDSHFSIFRDLQDLHSFAPLQTQILQSFAPLIFAIVS